MKLLIPLAATLLTFPLIIFCAWNAEPPPPPTLASMAAEILRRLDYGQPKQHEFAVIDGERVETPPNMGVFYGEQQIHQYQFDCQPLGIMLNYTMLRDRGKPWPQRFSIAWPAKPGWTLSDAVHVDGMPNTKVSGFEWRREGRTTHYGFEAVVHTNDSESEIFEVALFVVPEKEVWERLNSGREE